MDLKFGFTFTIIVISCLVCQAQCLSKRSIDLIAAHSLIGDTRLPKELYPTLYKLTLQPFPEEGYFKGEVEINITWLEPSHFITLHVDKDLIVNKTNIIVTQYAPDDQSIHAGQKFPRSVNIVKAERVLKKPLLMIFLERTFYRGTICGIKLTFTGVMSNDTSEGLFRHRYINTVTGEKKWYVATHLRPNLARNVFPCFDEPSFKAPFEITVGRQKSMTVLSNMPLVESVEIPDQPGWVWDHFKETPMMSTFTVGIVVSEFAFVTQGNTYDEKMTGLEVKVWARPDYTEALKNVTDKIVRSLQILQDFWGIPFPLPKLDCVALPNYQATKPADSWGLILFKESELTTKKSWHITQELVYQWLGSLVTPYWWTDAHINNALNRYITAYTTRKLDYGYDTFNNWPITMLYSIYYEFSKRYPHGKTTAIKQDSLSAKTELVFRMLNYTLGESTFKRALHKFMIERQLKTFFADDIWASINQQAAADHTLPKNTSITSMVSSWISKDRLPVVNVIRNYTNNSAMITQKVYLRERPHDMPDQERFIWWIPIVLIKQTNLNFSNTTPIAWMRQERNINVTGLPGPNDFIIVNPEEIGPFPVNYDSTNWEMIKNFLSNDENRMKIPVNTRAKLIHDAWNLAYAGELCFDTAFDMTLFLKTEKEYVAWDPIFTMIDHIGRHIDGSEVHKKFQAYVRHLLTPLYLEVGNEPQEGESDGTVHLRTSSKTFLCQAGYKPCVEEAQAAFRKWMESENPEEGNPVANQYICPVFEWGTKEEWEFGLQRIINFPQSRKQNERTYLLKTLAGCPIEAWKVEKLLNLTILEENGNFTDNDIYLIFSMLTGGATGYTALFNFLEKNWNTIRVKFESKPHLWNNMVTSATTVFKTQEGLDMVSGLYVARQGEFGTAEFVIEKALKNIKEETKWSDENLPVIEKWLTKYLKDNNINIENKM